MIRLARRPAAWRLMPPLALAAASLVPGCGQPGKGSVKVPHGVRARLGSGPPGTEPIAKPSAPARGTEKAKHPLPEVIGIKSRMSKDVPTP
jgi:hypothetical protein